MAQKRNPISLRLQTRLQGHEKRFASCWFTDSFFSQVYANDLVRRLYLGRLLQKGGSWYGEISESRVPETCISMQFLYRKYCIFSVVLDRRKEEYLLSTSGPAKQSFVRPRREDTTLFSQMGKVFSQSQDREEIKNKHTSNGKGPLALSKPNTEEKARLRNQDNFLNHCEGIYASLLSPRFRESTPSDKIVYQSIANSFGNTFATHGHPFAITLLDKWKDLLRIQTSCHYNVVPHSSYLSTIESIFDLSRANEVAHKNLTHGVDFRESSLEQVFSRGTNNLSDCLLNTAGVAASADPEKEMTKHSFASNLPIKLSSDWTSLSFIRGVSPCQNVEFCLYSVLFLCKKRFSFLKIKDLVFKMLASNPTVRGARLVCSGRQGGRSKSAMRAKKQSALWGETALSLFSSRLAFASTSVDTSFGQIGVKLWICYK